MVMYLKDRKIMLFITLTIIILLANYYLYRFPFTEPITPLITFGSFLDFIVTIPLLSYFLIIRRKFSLKYLFTIVAIGNFLAWFIIPQQYFQSVTLAKYLFIITKSAFFTFELGLILLFIRKIPIIKQEYRKSKVTNPYFHNQLEIAFSFVLANKKLISILASEISILYYSLFSWRKSVDFLYYEKYTYHKKTSAIAFYIMLIHALILESLGFHFLLHQLNPVISFITLIINIYTILLFIAEIRVICTCPYLVSEKMLHIQTGMIKKLIIPIDCISSIKHYQGPFKLKKQEAKYLFDATLPDFVKEKPTIEIILKQPLNVSYLYGNSKKVDKIHLNVDQANLFLESITSKLEKF